MLICKKCGETKNDLEFNLYGNKKKWSKGRVCKKCKKLQKHKNSVIRYQKTKDINKKEKLEASKEWHKNNKISVRKRNAEWQKNNPDKVKHNSLMSAHGISLETFNDILKNQNYVCAICNKPETKTVKKTGKIKNLCVDHNHVSNKIRGLLCDDCNIAIGKIKENIKSLKNAIKYLETYMEK